MGNGSLLQGNGSTRTTPTQTAPTRPNTNLAKYQFAIEILAELVKLCKTNSAKHPTNSAKTAHVNEEVYDKVLWGIIFFIYVMDIN